MAEALIILLDARGQEQARSVSSPSGSFELRAPEAGRYRIRVQRIGQRGWEAPAFDLAAGEVSRPTFHVPDLPFQLRELSASARRPDCAVTLGDASVGARLLEAAQTALALAETEMTTAKRSYDTQSYRMLVPLEGPVQDSVATEGNLTTWPIRSAGLDSLRRTGFVHGDWPAPSSLDLEPRAGPTYLGPDARVLFTDWFLGNHCIAVGLEAGQSKDSLLVARFKPAKGSRSTETLEGSLVFERGSLALRSLRFQFVARPRWAPPGSAGGEIRFARLPDGAWLPVKWTMHAPVPKVTEGRRYQFFGVTEVGGRVTGVRKPDGQRDREAEAALNL